MQIDSGCYFGGLVSFLTHSGFKREGLTTEYWQGKDPRREDTPGSLCFPKCTKYWPFGKLCKKEGWSLITK